MANEIVTTRNYESREILTPLQHNLLKILQSFGPKTRNELVNQLNTPRTTIYDNLLKLQKRKMLEKFTRSNGKRGRPLVLWKIKD